RWNSVVDHRTLRALDDAVFVSFLEIVLGDADDGVRDSGECALAVCDDRRGPSVIRTVKPPPAKRKHGRDAGEARGKRTQQPVIRAVPVTEVERFAPKQVT